MGQFEGIIQLIIQNADLLGTLLTAALTILKLSSWGKAKSDALDAVVNAVEKVGALEVKTGVTDQEGNLTPAAKDAIHHAVSKADPKKTPEALASRVAKSILA